MLLQFQEQTIDDFLIPSFSVQTGEIVIIQLLGGAFYRPVEFALIDILTGKTPNDGVEILSPFKYAKDFREKSWFRHHFFPMTVGTYLDKYANENNLVYKKAYDIPWMTRDLKVKALPTIRKRALAIYTTLSWTSNLIFDLAGIDPKGGLDIYKFVKTIIQQGCSAILIDNCDEFKDDCTTFVKAEYVGNDVNASLQHWLKKEAR